MGCAPPGSGPRLARPVVRPAAGAQGSARLPRRPRGVHAAPTPPPRQGRGNLQGSAAQHAPGDRRVGGRAGAGVRTQDGAAPSPANSQRPAPDGRRSRCAAPRRPGKTTQGS
jgi:hypothetical protein